jgi:hypothetical protein
VCDFLSNWLSFVFRGYDITAAPVQDHGFHLRIRQNSLFQILFFQHLAELPNCVSSADWKRGAQLPPLLVGGSVLASAQASPRAIPFGRGI